MPRFDRIVVGVDGSNCSVEALRGASEEGRMRGAQVEVLHVWHLPYVGLPEVSPPHPDDEFEASASAVLDHVITAAGEVNGSLERRVAKGHAANELITASRRADLVVVGCRGHGGVAGTLLGSVSHQVATHDECPVVVVRRSGP
jgi:nucleotide-binding universal stress UspA family protein